MPLSSPDVYFRFEGGGNTGSADIVFPSVALKAFPDSVLTKLADDAWKSEDRKDQGESKDNPLITRPLEVCREHWSENLAFLIWGIYLWKYTNNNEQFAGPIAPAPVLPAGVDIQDAMVVLDYYGLMVDPNVIDLSRLSSEEQIRSKLFLKEIPLMEDAKDFVVDYLKNNPERETLFLFAGKTDDIEAIQHHSECSSRRVHGPKELVAVGGKRDAYKHFGWAQDVNQRQIFLNQLKEELPTLDIQYLNMDFTSENANMQFDPPKGEFCWLECESSAGGGWILKRVVLSVKVPGRTSKKRPRES